MPSSVTPAVLGIARLHPVTSRHRVFIARLCSVGLISKSHNPFCQIPQPKKTHSKNPLLAPGCPAHSRGFPLSRAHSICPPWSTRTSRRDITRHRTLSFPGSPFPLAVICRYSLALVFFSSLFPRLLTYSPSFHRVFPEEKPQPPHCFQRHDIIMRPRICLPAPAISYWSSGTARF